MKAIKALTYFIISILLSTPLYANASYFGEGSLGHGHLWIKKSDRLEIINEDLTINLYKGYAEVKVEYTIKNTKDAIKAKLGFPCIIYDNPDVQRQEISDYHIYDNTEEIKSHYWLSKKTISWIKVPYGFSDDYSGNEHYPSYGWYFSNLSFDNGETKKVTITYTSHYMLNGGGVSGDDSIHEAIFRYLLSFGSSWKGPIKKGTITINPKNVGRFKIFPRNRFKKIKSGYVWKFNNLEPTGKDNLVITFLNAYNTFYIYSGALKETMVYKVHNSYYYQPKIKRVTASSFHKDSKFTYHPSNVLDKKFTTAWVEGKDGDGVGESITLTMAKPTRLSKILITPGYNSTKKVFYKNNRIAELEVTINGKYKKRVTLPDGYTSYSPYSPNAYQWISTDEYKDPAKTVTIKILKVYKGSQHNDTCISEILLFKKLKKLPGNKGR